MAAAAPATTPAPMPLMASASSGADFGLVDGRIGGRIHDDVAAGLNQGILDARRIGKVELGTTDEHRLCPMSPRPLRQGAGDLSFLTDNDDTHETRTLFDVEAAC